MKTGIWLALIISFGMIACDKDKFETVPQLELKSRSTDIVPVNGTLRLNIEFRDKEGDVNDSLLIVRQRLNVRGPLQLLPSPYGIPDFPKTDKGEFEVSLDYQFGLVFGLPPLRIPGSNPVKNEIDTLRLKIVARDKEGNKSDTLVIDNVYVIR
ncbi:MAG TPA: hypothetical protein VFZ33_04250 [Chitinophagaceae bacterium]